MKTKFLLFTLLFAFAFIVKAQTEGAQIKLIDNQEQVFTVLQQVEVAKADVQGIQLSADVLVFKAQKSSHRILMVPILLYRLHLVQTMQLANTQYTMMMEVLHLIAYTK